MKMSEQINELAKALAAAQSELENASKNSNNPHFKSKYADLAEVLNTVRPVFARNGLSIVQAPEYGEGIASVETTILHQSGQWMSSCVSAPVSKQDAQGVGSAVTYCRRYGLAAMAGIAQEDDDANAAVAGPGKRKPKVTDEEHASAVDQLEACATLDELKAAFFALPKHVQEAVEGKKNEMKQKLAQEKAA